MPRSDSTPNKSCNFESTGLAQLACLALQRDSAESEPFFDNWITKQELATHLRISEGLITKLMYEEGLPHLKVRRAVRFLLRDVYAWFHKKGMKL
ncbi:MAG: helix-turn-helix domain-containing protein [Silvanigrellaceae bacterium]|nr:helix-turn-helix domain-containing protein [Silvanigrellaceae bacterium]